MFDVIIKHAPTLFCYYTMNTKALTKIIKTYKLKKNILLRFYKTLFYKQELIYPFFCQEAILGFWNFLINKVDW